MGNARFVDQVAKVAWRRLDRRAQRAVLVAAQLTGTGVETLTALMTVLPRVLCFPSPSRRRSSHDPTLRVGWLATFVLATLIGAGCSRRGPESDLRPLFEALGDPTESVADLSGALLKVLDADSRRAIEARATKLGSQAGVPVDPAHVLQARGLTAHKRVADFEVEVTSEDTATITVHLTPLGPAPADGSAPDAVAGGEVVKLSSHLEEGGWRLSLTDLAKLVGRVPLVADGEGGR
jgi:hypothetical protein